MSEQQIFQDLGTFVSAEMSPDKKRVIVKFSPTTGKFAGQEFSRSAFITSLDSTTRETIKSLTAGEAVTIDTVKNGNYRNLKGISKGHKKIEKKLASSGNNDYNQRAARGQALTLATQFAISVGKGDDDTFILSQVGRFLNLSETVQEAKDVNTINQGSQTPQSNVQTSTAVQSGTTPTATTTGIQSSTPATTVESSAVDDDLSDLLDL